MTRRERLMATMRGDAVDRPAVSFYEINGVVQKPSAEPFNIFSDPSWQPLLQLAREKSDVIVMRGVPFGAAPPDPCAELRTHSSTTDADGSQHGVSTLRAGNRTLTTRTRRDRDVATVWTTEHLLKDVDDFRAWLDLPEQPAGGEPLIEGILTLEAELGESGIVMIDTADPLCMVAPLFDMATYTITALTEQELFHRALERAARVLHARTEAIARALPGRLWRIYGPEYASPPYLPPALFEEYVVRYDRPMVESIQRYGGFARLHSHGNLRAILDHIAATGCSGLDPIEPPPQGDVELREVRERYGQQFVLFGNLEASDLENLPTDQFRRKIDQALREGTGGSGRGFVLMPSACPYGRTLSPRAMRNYEAMIDAVDGR